MTPAIEKLAREAQSRWRGLSRRERRLWACIPAVALLGIAFQTGIGPGMASIKAAAQARSSLAALPGDSSTETPATLASRAAFEKEKASAQAANPQGSLTPANASALALASAGAFAQASLDAAPGWPRPSGAGRWSHQIELRLAGPFDEVSKAIAASEALAGGDAIELAIDRIDNHRVAARAVWSVQSGSASWGAPSPTIPPAPTPSLAGR